MPNDLQLWLMAGPLVPRTLSLYVSVTAHYIDDEWVLQNHVLQTREFNEAHTGNYLAVLLQNVCREWNINIKDTALVTDNAKNMMLARVGAEMDPHV